MYIYIYTYIRTYRYIHICAKMKIGREACVII